MCIYDSPDRWASGKRLLDVRSGKRQADDHGKSMRRTLELERKMLIQCQTMTWGETTRRSEEWEQKTSSQYRSIT